MKKMPRLDHLNVNDYEEMVEMTNSRRQRYFEYLHASRTAKVNDDVSNETCDEIQLFKINNFIYKYCSIFSIDKKVDSSKSV